MDKYIVTFKYTAGNEEKEKTVTLYATDERDARVSAKFRVRDELRSVRCIVKKS